VVEVALSGNLGFVPLSEVLRLLTRSDQRGSVEVRGEDVRGRIFITKKGISLATTAEDRDLHTHLVNSAYVDDSFLRKVVSGDATFADLGEREAAIVNLLREITIESLYSLTDKGATFEVTEDATTPYASSRPFELEAILDETRRRTGEWATVHKVIADLDATIRMNRDIGDRQEIKVNREAWRLLAELGSGASVKTMAERLGTTEFWIAKVAAEMTEEQLLVLSEDFAPEPVRDEAYPRPATVTVEDEQDEEDKDPNESWWVEPEHDQAGDTPAAETEVDATEQAEPSKDSRFGHFVRAAQVESPAPVVESAELAEEPVDGYEDDEYLDAPVIEPAADLEDVEEDTEAFLEKVFSQLEVNGQPEVEEEGHGLLRRRRMGSVLKEIEED
jgi:hypothetical protein